MNPIQISAGIAIASLFVYLVMVRNEPKWGMATIVVSSLVWWGIASIH